MTFCLELYGSTEATILASVEPYLWSATPTKRTGRKQQQMEPT